MNSSSKSNPTTATSILFFFLLVLHSSSASSPIKTVVILVMENRSFDHMLGWMKKLNPDINGVTGSESNPLSTSNTSSHLLFFSNLSSFLTSDPPHSFSSINSQLFSPPSSPHPTMNGFAQQACSLDCTLLPQQVMSGFDPLLLPVYSSLLSNFAIFDRWFSSVPASTQPNRLFLHSATSHGATSNDPALLALGYPQTTIFDNLDKDSLSFGIYYQNIPATLFYKSLRRLKFLTTRFWSYSSYFKKHAMQGKLPSYVVVEQRYMGSSSSPANDDHPSHDVGEGQRLVKEVYEVLRASPLWNQTLFIITYDEHGGFFDHVPTPTLGVPSPDDLLGPNPFRFNFDRLGVRVPTIMVSPWIDKGTVVHKPEGTPFASSEYEHSSIPATIKKIFNLSSPFLTRRDAWAGTFEGILHTRKEPRTDCPVKLPEPIKLGGEIKDDREVSEFQGELIDLARVLKGEHMLNDYNDEKMKKKKKMSVKEGKEYVEDAVKRYLQAGKLAIRMGADPDRVLQMRSSLSTPPNRSP